MRIARYVSFNGGLTQVTNSFYRGTSPRIYVDSAPHTVANGAVTLSGWRNAYASLRYRHIGNYRLDGADPTIRAAGLDVLDLAVTKPIRPCVDLNVDIDNLTDKVCYETHNYLESRLSPDGPSMRRIHGTPVRKISSDLRTVIFSVVNIVEIQTPGHRFACQEHLTVLRRGQP